MAPSGFSSFAHLVDNRILRALSDLGFSRPTPIQQKAIPLVLSESRDVLARAPTGSGKTVAYCIPILQKILTAKTTSNSEHSTKSLVLVPTRELAEQVSACLKSLTAYFEGQVSVANVTSGTVPHLERTLLGDKPDIVVATPSRALALLRSKSLSLSSLELLVIDEADLILSYGHDEDVKQIFTGSYLPNIFQTMLMSATMSEDIELLKTLALRDPVSLMLDDAEDDRMTRLSQYYVNCTNGDNDKFLLTYIILKLKLIAGKTLLFVNDVDRCYRLKLFLEQFSIRSCVLNSELPLNSRYHVVQEFNKGVYDYIIATDESGGKAEQDTDDESSEDENEDNDESPDFLSTQRDNEAVEESSEVEEDQAPLKKRKRAATPPPTSSKKAKLSKGKGKQKQDREFGVTRGIDFVNVACVINFDLPSSSRGYTHRIGRTARAGKGGTAISFVLPPGVKEKNPWNGPSVSTDTDTKVWKRIVESQTRKRGLASSDSVVKEYRFDPKQIEAFKYRMEDAIRSVTRKAVKEARVKELKNEVMNSSKLKAHFEDNPLDLEYLRHDKPLHPTRVQPHMKFVPKYLMPKVAAVQAKAAAIQEESSAEAKGSSNAGFVPFKKDTRKSRGGSRGGRGGRGGRRKDPLRKFGR